MKILHICTNINGGAGIAACRLHFGLKSIGVDSKMLVLYRGERYSDFKDIVGFTQKKSLTIRSLDKLRYGFIAAEYDAYKKTHPEGFDIFNDDRTKCNISEHPLVKDADVINLHWVANMVNPSEFFLKIGKKPVVWTLHDFNPITGGCHVPRECTKYETGCGSCPQLGSNDPDDLSRRIFLRKEKAYKGHNISIVAPSKYLADHVKKSLLFKNFEIYNIPHGVSTSIFKKRDKSFSRDLLRLPQDKTLVLFGTANIRAIENKGFKYLLEALKLVKDRRGLSGIGLVTLGPKQSLDILSKGMGCPIYELGYIYDETLLSAVYSSCDLTVVPSVQEIFSLTCLESMACGTPVVGSKTGGMLEMIIPQKTGFLMEPKGIKDLADKIEYMVTHSKEREAMGENARKMVEETYPIEAQARSYLTLYEALLKK